MSFSQKVVVAVGADDQMNKLLLSMKGLDFLNHSEIHIVHVFNIFTYLFREGKTPLVYANINDRPEIERLILLKIQDLIKQILPEGFEGKIVSACLFSDKPKEKFSDYVNQHKADLVVVAKKEKKGIFESSFAQYVNNHTSANLLLLKK